MKKSKVVKQIEKWLVDEMKDKELQERYDRFKQEYDNLCNIRSTTAKNLKEAKHKFDVYTNIVLNMVVSDLPLSKEISTALSQAGNAVQRNEHIFEEVNNDAEEKKRKIKMMEDHTDNKLFHYWSICSKAGIIKKAWMDWRPQFAGKIF